MLNKNLLNDADDRLAKPFSADQKKQYLDLLLEGVAHIDILHILGSDNKSYTHTRKHDTLFVEQINYIKKNRKNQIKSTLYKYATGKCKIVKCTYTAVLDDFGDPKRDEDGKQVFYCKQKEVSIIPPNPQLIMFYLKMEAEKNGEEVGYISPDQLLEELGKALKK